MHHPRLRSIALATGLLLLASVTPATRADAPTREADTLADVVQLTSGFSRAGEAYFSPDGHAVVFQASLPGEDGYAMYLANVKREGDRVVGLDVPVRISMKGSKNTCGWFAPDGKAMLFASTADRAEPDAATSRPGYQRQSGRYMWAFEKGMEIYRVDDWRALMRSDVKAESVPTVRLTDNDAYDAECSFSPDGKSIVFASNRESIDGKPDVELFVMKSDGSHVVRLTDVKGYDGGPFFSPDGKRLVYRSDRKGDDNLQVYVADLTFDASGDITGLTNEKKLTEGENVNWAPFWHADGNTILYASSAQGHQNYEVYAVRADGSLPPTRITFSDGFDGLPAFSADGRTLLWASKRTPDQTTQIFAARMIKLP